MRPTIRFMTALVAVAGCHSHHAPSGPDEVVVSCQDAHGASSFASDESWVKFLEADSAGKVVAEDCKAPVLVTPAPGATVAGDMPPAFSFTPTQPACAQALLPARHPLRACPAQRRRPSWLRALSPIGTAEAHCPAVNGPNYLLTLTTAGETAPFYTALLSVTSFAPNKDIWKKALSGRTGQTVQLTIKRAVFSRGNVIEGPFVQKQPFALTVAR